MGRVFTGRARMHERSRQCRAWRRLGFVGSFCMSQRCCTVAPECASPSTPSPSTSTAGREKRDVSEMQNFSAWLCATGLPVSFAAEAT